jgi:hypothetical protein
MSSESFVVAIHRIWIQVSPKRNKVYHGSLCGYADTPWRSCGACYQFIAEWMNNTSCLSSMQS